MMKTNFMKLLTTAIILLFIGIAYAPSITASEPTSNQTAYSDENGTLSGYVTDPAMNPIEGARVRVYFHETYEENYTDSSGYYNVTNIPICWCLKNATASKEGYTTEWVLLAIGENTTYDFVLMPLDTIYVDDDNTDGPWDGTESHPYQYIQDGIDDADDGDTVFVYSGRYNENVVVDKLIHLTGEDRDSTVIDGGGIGIVVHVSHDYVNITGFTIQNGSGGIWVQESNFTTITNNNLIKNRFSGIHLQISSNNIIKDNILISNKQVGISLCCSINNKIMNNTISKSSIEGITLYWSNYNNIIDNTLYKNGQGISLFESSKYNVITCNNLSNNYNSGIVSGSSYNDISKNLIFNNIDGIRIYGSAKYNMIVGNNISGTSDGIWIEGHYNTFRNNNINNFYQGILVNSNNNNITGNTIRNCYRGIMFESSKNNRITGNTVFKNYCGVQLYPSSHNNTISDNNFYENDNALDLWDSSFNRILQNSFKKNVFGIHMYISDNNTIHGNNISELSLSSMGIMLLGGNNNSITRNNIIGHIFGLSIDVSYDNYICENNFIKNLIHSDEVWLKDEFNPKSNIWCHNYWDNWRISLPKPILCNIEYTYITSYGFPIFLPWIKFDKSPAREPYDIPIPECPR